jgi:hypothetical protein
MKCPNKNDNNWKLMENVLGSEMAYASFIGFSEIPNIINHPLYISNPLGLTKESLVKSVLREIASENKIQYLKDKKGDQFEDIDKYLTLREQQLYRNLSEARSKSDFTRASQLERELADVTKDIELLKKNRNLETITAIGQKDVERLKDILNGDVISSYNINEAFRIIDLWENGYKIFVSNDDTILHEVQYNELVQLSSDVDSMSRDLRNKAANYLNNFVSNEIGEDKELVDIVEDISRLKRGTLSIRHINSVYVKTLHRIIKRAQQKAVRNANEIQEKLDKGIEPLLERYTKEQVYDMLMDEVNGEKTGDLITKISNSYFNDFNEQRNAYERVIGNEKATEAKKKKATERWNKFIKENQLTFDVRKLFPDKDFPQNKKDIEAHEKELIEMLGEKEFNRKKELVRKKVEKYKKDYEGHKLDFESTLEKEEAAKKLQEWEIANSPYWYSEFKEKGKTINGVNNVKVQGFKYTYNVPSKSKYYNDKFRAIEDDEDFYNYYNLVLDTLYDLREILPASDKFNVKFNQLPFVQKSLMKTFNDDGIKSASLNLLSKVQDSFRVNEGSDMYNGYQNPNTNEFEYFLQAPTGVNEKRLNELENLYEAQFMEETKSKPTKADRVDFRKKAKIQLAKEQSFNINNVIRAYAFTSEAFKYKSQIEDEVKLLQRHVHNMVELGKDKSGTVYKKENPYTNVKAATDSHIFNKFFERPRKDEGEFGKKILTADEKERAKEYERLLDSDLTDSQKKQIALQYENLGSRTSASRIFDRIMDWIRLKGIGFSPTSAFTNLNVGMVSNVIAASGNKYFSFGDFYSGLKYVYSQLFNRDGSLDKLMDMFEFIDDSSREMHSSNDIKKEAKFYEPMYFNQQVEKFNQLPIVIAMMKKKKFGEKTLWEMFQNDEIGKDFLESKEFFDFHELVEAQTTKIHGDYSVYSNHEAKDKSVGRMLLMFRTWMGETYAERFQGLEKDVITGDEIKGRYRSYAAFFKKEHAMVLPLIKDTIDLYTGKSELSEVDLLNMRRNITELVILMGLTSLALGLKMAAGDDDDWKKNFMYNFTVNQLIRTKTDLMSYFDPASFKTITQNALPIMQILTDSGELLHSGYKLVIGEDIIESGVNAGTSRSGREVMQYFPILSPAYRLYNQGSQIFKK